MEILLTWAAYLTLGVIWLALGWAYLAPRLPHHVRPVIIGLLARGAVLALIVTADATGGRLAAWASWIYPPERAGPRAGVRLHPDFGMQCQRGR